MIGPEVLSLNAIENYSVASSTPTDNYFISNKVDDTNDFLYESPMLLPDCTN